MLRTLIDKRIRATAYKPVQSGAQWKEGKWIAPDVDMYRKSLILPMKKDVHTY